jgi:hypothetical protein
MKATPDSTATCPKCGRPGDLMLHAGRRSPADYYECQACDHHWVIDHTSSLLTQSFRSTWRDFALCLPRTRGRSRDAYTEIRLVT